MKNQTNDNKTTAPVAAETAAVLESQFPSDAQFNRLDKLIRALKHKARIGAGGNNELIADYQVRIKEAKKQAMAAMDRGDFAKATEFSRSAQTMTKRIADMQAAEKTAKDEVVELMAQLREEAWLAEPVKEVKGEEGANDEPTADTKAA